MNSSRSLCKNRRIAGVLPLLSALFFAPRAVWAQEVASEGEAAIEVEPLLPAEGLFRPETWVSLGERLLTNVVDYVPRLVAALILLVLFLIMSRVAARIVSGVLRRTQADPALVGILSKICFYSIFLIGAIMSIAQAGIAVAPLLASVSVIGLAAGLAAQDSLSNLVAGLTILWDRPFRLNDRVTLADTYGEVTDISVRTTTVRTPGHLELIVPNKDVIDGVIINHSRTADLRLDVPLGIGYGESIDDAREALLQAARKSDYVDHERQGQVVVKGLGDSSVDLELRAWLRDPVDEMQARFDLVERAKKALDAAGIEIPFPQRVLHLETPPETPIPIRSLSEEGLEATA